MALINDHFLKLGGGYLFPEIARRIDAYARANPGARIIRCDIGDVTEPLPPAAVEAMREAAAELGRRETFHGYGPPAGYEFLRRAIAEGDLAEAAAPIDPSEIFVSDGSKGDCGHVLEILGAGNRVAIADPVYPVYVDTNVMAGRTGSALRGGGYEGITYLPATPGNGFVPAPPAAGMDVVYLCFPNNPTGAMITRRQLADWVEYALANDAILLYDAAYAAFISDPELPRSVYEIEAARRCALEFHSFSKSGGFTGVRCGYTVCPRTVEGETSDGRRVPLHDLWTRRWATRSNGVSYPVQRAAEALYSPAGRRQVRSLVDHYLGNARILREGFQALGFRVWGGVHAPYVWVACPEGLSSWQTFDLLLSEAQIAVVPGAGFGSLGEGYFRMSAFNTKENMEEAVRRLRTVAGAKRSVPQRASHDSS